MRNCPGALRYSCEVFVRHLGCVSGLSFSCRRDCDVVGVLVMRFGIRSIAEDIAVSRWSSRKEPEEGGPSRVLKYLYVSDVVFVVQVFVFHSISFLLCRICDYEISGLR